MIVRRVSDNFMFVFGGIRIINHFTGGNVEILVRDKVGERKVTHHSYIKGRFKWKYRV